MPGNEASTGCASPRVQASATPALCSRSARHGIGRKAPCSQLHPVRGYSDHSI
ncbi:predicted protein [Plenodomus lingam JN3]|uniref:Predicted protein n=1 Tax=Leptosphaeria maculans (strain JN3 / isolate v23.1.3 / race Av1-4-5-6-7-8) TaxID=985895 RepID=E4ZLI0_LEPMJ|nr:predicted protein [Plenodomus lingam JN3]CBX92339.1 predicted protein [Plenodomus lingam JN3]